MSLEKYPIDTSKVVVYSSVISRGEQKKVVGPKKF